MEKLDILKEIHKKQVLIEEELQKQTPDLEEYSKFFENYETSSLKKIAEIDIVDLAIFLTKSKAPEIFSLDELGYAYEMNRDILENFSIDEFEELLNELRELYEEDEETAEKLLDNMKNKNIFNKKTSNPHIRNIKSILEDTNCYKADLKSIFELYYKNPEAAIEGICLSIIIQGIKEEYETIDDDIDQLIEKNGYGRIKDKERKKIIQQTFKDEYEVKKIVNHIGIIKKYYEELERSKKNTKRNLRKKLGYYETLEKELFSALEKGEVTNISKMLSKIDDENLRIKILKAVYKHNIEIYKEIQKEYRDLSQNSDTKYQRLLSKYGISPEQYEVETIMGNTIDDVEAIINILQKRGLKEPNYILTTLQTTNLETIEVFNKLLEKGIISPSLLTNHKNLLNPESKEYQNFIHNMKYINDNSINPHYFRTSQEMLTLDTNILQENINTLRQYDLLTSMRTGIDCSFLSYSKISESIDLLLELGYEKLLEENITLLNYKDNFPRLVAIKELNIQVTDVTDLIEILSASKFLIPDEDINQYIYNAASNKVSELLENKSNLAPINIECSLTEFNNTKRTFDIGGVIVSKNKVYRNLESEQIQSLGQDGMLYAVINGSVLNDSELEKVEKVIKKQGSSKVIVK